MKISKKISTLRKSQHLTQKGMESLLGTGKGSIQNYELGKTKPHYDFLNKLCNEFPQHTLWLMTDIDDISKVNSQSLTSPVK